MPPAAALLASAGFMDTTFAFGESIVNEFDLHDRPADAFLPPPTDRVVKIYSNIFWKKNTFLNMTPLKIGIIRSRLINQISGSYII